jgi:hypothetical protein
MRKMTKEKSCGNGPAKTFHLGKEAEPEAALRLHDLAEVERVDEQQRSGQRERQRQLVADHLRRTAQAAQQRVLAVGGPAAERHAINAQRRDGQNEQDADVEVGQPQVGLHAEDLDLRAEWNDDDRDQRDRHGEKRRQQIEERVGAGGHDTLLRQQLEDIGDGLQQAVRADAIGARAQLNMRQHLALDPLQVGQSRQQREQHDRGFDQAEEEEVHGAASSHKRDCRFMVYTAPPALPSRS